MRKDPRMFRLLIALSILLCLPFIQPGWVAAQQLAFSGGPNGGTFQYFSNGIATRLSQGQADLEVANLASAGSVENIRRVEAKQADFGIAYSGDIFLARRGTLSHDPQKYQNVLAVAYLYGAPVQLIVLDDSPIRAVGDLAGKKVTVGGAGSGAATAAERYFKALGIWDDLAVEYIGYSKAAVALTERRIDAMWVMAGYPTAAVQQAATVAPIRLIDVWSPAQASDFFKNFPFYAAITIPADTYSTQAEAVKSFQDSAIWVAGRQVDPTIVNQALGSIFSPDGLEYMLKVKNTAREMSVNSGLNGIVTPVHPGAKEFWKSQGLSFFPPD